MNCAGDTTIQSRGDMSPSAKFPFLFLFGLLTSMGLSRSTTVSATDFNVRDFGAAADGKTLDNPAIQKAIDAAEAAGGGTVVIPAGTYLCGSIELKSTIHLLDSGAIILGAPQNMNAYDETEPWPSDNPYQDGGHCYFHNSLIWGENLNNVSITGGGMIKGGGLVSADKLLDDMCGFSAWGKPAPAQPVPANYPPSRLGNKAIALKLCNHVLIRDITISHGGHFAILVTGCNNMTVDNVTMDTNRDGIDIDCCHNTMVSNCRINSPGDDGLCLKSTYALGHNVLTENLTIVNCQVSGFEEGSLLDGTMRQVKPGHRRNGRIKFGTESSGGFRNCTVSNCTFRSCFGLALEEVDGGIMEDITINNLSMVDVADYAIYLTTGSRNRGGNVQHPSECRNIFISNVVADGVGKASGIQVTGTAEQPLENIRLENIRLISNGGGTVADAAKPFRELGTRYPEARSTPSYGIFAQHVKGLELADISTSFLQADARPAAFFADIYGLEIDNFKPQVSPNVPPAIISQDVRNVVIRDSPLIHN
jgi:polygalacturonase